MTFLSPLFLVGLLAAGIPLLLHLSRSRRTRTLKFSTTRFFTDQFLRSYRMSRLKELLLLACRMALFALFAVALAQPLLLPKGGAALPGGSRAVVLVVDNTASMGYVENGVSQLDRAKKAARELLDTLKPGDTASIVLPGRRVGGPEALFPQPTPDLSEVAQAVGDLQVATLGTDLSAAVVKAQDVLKGSTAPSKEVYVLSDLQDTGWELPDADATINAARADVSFTFIGIRPAVAANVAVTAIQYAAARPMVGVPFTIRPQIAVQGELGGEINARLHVDGKMVSEKRVERQPNGTWAPVRFYHTFLTAGWHTGFVEVDGDTWPEDNRRFFAFDVLDAIPVLAVNGAPSAVAAQDELFFLTAALTADVEGKRSIQVTTISPRDLAGADLSKVPLVILANVETLLPAAIEKLERFTDDGGSLLVFLGDKASPAFYNPQLAGNTRIHGGLMPGRLKQIEGDPKGSEAFAHIAEIDGDHPALAAFADPKFATLTGPRGIGLRALWGVDVADGAAVLARASTRSPLLVEKAFGKGRVVLCTIPCDRDWSNFPVRPAFVPFLHRMVAYLAQEPSGRQGFSLTGDEVPLAVGVSEGIPQLAVRKPAPGNPFAEGALGYPVISNDPEQPLVFTDTAQAGIYTVVREGAKDSPRFAVNLDGFESDLTYLDDVLGEPSTGDRTEAVRAGLVKLLPGAVSVNYIPDPGGAAAAALTARQGVRLWDWILLAVLAIALIEPWLANRISLRHYGKPAEVGRPTGLERLGRGTARVEGRPTASEVAAS